MGVFIYDLGLLGEMRQGAAGICREAAPQKSGLRANRALTFHRCRECRKNETFRPQAWRGDNCARQDETDPGERSYSMSGGNRFTDGFSSVRGLSAMPPALMFAKPFDQHLCGLTSGNARLSFLAKGSFAKMRQTATPQIAV